MNKSYVDQHDGGYWVNGTRVSLDSVVLAFLQGLSAETIARDCFPILTLEQVYGSLAYYLAHRETIDSYLKDADAEFESLRQSTHGANRKLIEQLTAARRQMLAARP